MSKFLYITLIFLSFCSICMAQGLGRTPTPVNLTLTSSAVEYEYVVGQGTQPLTQIQIKARTLTDLKFGWSSGDTSDSYITIEAGSVYFENDLKYTGSVFIKGTSDGDVAELLLWN